MGINGGETNKNKRRRGWNKCQKLVSGGETSIRHLKERGSFFEPNIDIFCYLQKQLIL